MNKINCLIPACFIILIFFLTGCSLTLKSPEIHLDLKMDKDADKSINFFSDTISLEKELDQQSEIKKVSSWEDLNYFFKNNSSISISSSSNFKTDFEENINPVKIDSHYAYSVNGTSIFIMDIDPNTGSKPLAEIKFKNKPYEFFVNNDRLIVLGISNINDIEKKQNNYYNLKIFDISDKSKPMELVHLDIEGDYLSPRIIDNNLYLLSLVNSFQYKQRNLTLPNILKDESSLNCDDISTCDVPNIYYFALPYNDYNFLNISILDIQNIDKEIKREFYILPQSFNIFSSGNDIYLSYEKYLDREKIKIEASIDLLANDLPDEDKQKIHSIMITENFILDKFEKQNKIIDILDYYLNSISKNKREDFEEKISENINKKIKELFQENKRTIIHKINLSNEKTKHQSFGEIEGKIVNQHSLNIEDNNCFVFTLKNKLWHLSSLDNDMKILGEIEEPTNGAQIVSIRFMQNRLYLTTDKDKNTAIVFDFTDPEHLFMIGKLELPKELKYLYPYNNNILLGLNISLEKNEEGKTKNEGVKISLLDVSNVNSPKEIDSQILGGEGSYSVAQDNPESFFISQDKNILIFPISIKNSHQGMFGNQNFDGLILFDIDAKRLSFKALIDYEERRNIEKISYHDNMIYVISDNNLRIDSLKSFQIFKNFSFVVN